MERIASVPDTRPEAAGVKTTLNVRRWPAARLAGSDNPLNVNAVLEILACVTVTLSVPVFFRVWVKV